MNEATQSVASNVKIQWDEGEGEGKVDLEVCAIPETEELEETPEKVESPESVKNGTEEKT